MDIEKLRDLFSSGYGRKRLAQTLGTTEWQVRKALKTGVSPYQTITLPAHPTRIVAIGDTHCPFHDEEAITSTIKYITDYQPHIVVLLGDMIDFGPVSRFDQVPARRLAIQEDIDCTIELLSSIRQAAKKAAIYFLEGNHESRLAKYLVSRAPELFQLRQLTVPALLELDRLEIQWRPADQELQVESFLFFHGDAVRKWGGYSAQAMLDKYGANVVFGHVHRLAQAFRTFQDRVFTGIEAGCLCVRQNPGYQCRYPNWQQGIVTITMYDAVDYHVELHRVNKGRLLATNKVYHG